MVLVLGTVFSQAQTDPQAKQLLDDVAKKAQSYKNIKLEFEYALDNPNAAMNRSTTGSVLLSGQQYVLEFFGLKRICDGTTIWDLFLDDEEGNITRVDQSDEESISPTEIFTVYQNGFKIKMGEGATVDGKKYSSVELFPENPDEVSYSKIVLVVDAKSKSIVAMKEYGTNGTIATYTVLKMETNLELPANTFTFDKAAYPNFYMQDLRLD